MDRIPTVQRFETFLTQASTVALSHPNEAYHVLAEMWQASTGANWVWFWARNPIDGLWQLVAQSAPNGSAGGVQPFTHAVPKGTHCGSDYAIKTGDIVVIEDIQTWERDVDGAIYRVALRDLLMARGCRSSILIPLVLLPPISGPGSSTQFSPSFSLVIVLHFSERVQSAAVAEDTLRTMARLSSQRVTDSYERQVRDIAVRLSSLAATCLSNRAEPQSQRDNYLAGVLGLIQEHLLVSYVSVFFETYTGDAIECVASTGLYDCHRKLVTPNDYRAARYTRNDRNTATWLSYETGKVVLKPFGSSLQHDQKYTELPPDKSEEGVSWVIVPIARDLPLSSLNGEGLSRFAGVIRCVDCVLVRDVMCQHAFDEIEVNLLRFIAAQVGPILDTMLAGVQRELTISIIKHDFYAPLRMIGDTLDTVQDLIAANKVVPPAKFDNLQVAILVASNLVSQLDVDPTRSRVFAPSRTYLEGDIVARLKAMMSHYANAETGMRITFGDFPGVIPALNVDRVLIERVFFNLITNAIKYGRPNTTIEVLPRSDSNNFYVDVINHGMGITSEEEEHLFKPGYRSPRAQKMGAGLGLSIAKAAMERHGGRLVITAPRDPTVFTMVFPRKLATK